MSIVYPVSGGFYTLAMRFLDPSFAFAMGWNYWFQWAIPLPLEITVAGQVVQYWGDDIMPLAGWITIFYVVLSKWPLPTNDVNRPLTNNIPVIISVFGTLGFAEEEFWSSVLKLFTVIMFVFIGMYVFQPSTP